MPIGLPVRPPCSLLVAAQLGQLEVLTLVYLCSPHAYEAALHASCCLAYYLLRNMASCTACWVTFLHTRSVTHLLASLTFHAALIDLQACCWGPSEHRRSIKRDMCAVR